MITIATQPPTDEQVTAAIELVLTDWRTENPADTGSDLAIVMDTRNQGVDEILSWVGTFPVEQVNAYLLVAQVDAEQLDRAWSWG